MRKNFLSFAVLLILLWGAVVWGQDKPGFFSKQEKVPAPDFSLNDLEGKTFKLSQFLGNPVVMFFGTTWCPVCRSELSLFRNLYNKYALRGLKFLYIDINESSTRVAHFAKQNSFPYIILLDSDATVATRYNIIGVPTLVLVDREGNLLHISHTTTDLPIEKVFTQKK